MKRRHARLARLTKQIDEAPIAASVMESAFDTFRATGELPALSRIAKVVVDRVLQASARDEEHVPYETRLQRLISLLDRIQAGEVLPPDPMVKRRHLLEAAVNGLDDVQEQARHALRMLARAGHDVAEAHVLENPELPESVTQAIDGTCASYVVERGADEDSTVGPPVPRGRALIDNTRALLRLVSEVMPSLELAR